MLYEFAITPDVFNRTDCDAQPELSVILVELLKGLRDNGLVANLHKDKWGVHVSNDMLPQLPPGLRDKLTTCLALLRDRHRLIRHPASASGNPTTDLDWLNLALVSHARIPLSGIVLSQNLQVAYGIPNPDLIILPNVLESQQWLGRRRSLTLSMVEADYRNVLAPVLRHAKSLTLIDPHMNSQEAKFRRTISLCCQLMGQRGYVRMPGRIDINVAFRDQEPDGRTANDYLNQWQHALAASNGGHGHRIRVFLWDWDAGAQGMHDRFIVTDQCGISVAGGLDCRDPAHRTETTWTLLDEEDRVQTLQKYDPAGTPFRLVASREYY